MTPAKIKIGTGKIKCNSQKSSSQATTSMKSNHEYKLEESRGLEQKLLKRYGDFEQVEKIFHWWMQFIIPIRSHLQPTDGNIQQLIYLNNIRQILLYLYWCDWWQMDICCQELRFLYYHFGYLFNILILRSITIFLRLFADLVVIICPYLSIHLGLSNSVR